MKNMHGVAITVPIRNRVNFLVMLMCASIAQATNYYVASSASSPVGNDSNNGLSASTPWLTTQHAVSNVTCGDTVNFIADGNFISGDALLPYTSCIGKIILQSSKFSQFAPDTFRTNPATDCPSSLTCLYGRLQTTSTGIYWFPETHGSSLIQYGGCVLSNIAASVITIDSACNLPNLTNGSQVEFEINVTNDHNATTLPSGIPSLTHVYVVNCGVSPACGAANSTLQISAISGGSPITLGACTGTCDIAAISISEPLQFTAGSQTITSPDAFGSAITNGTPVAMSAAGLQVFGTLPTGFNYDTPYYVQNISGRTFKLSTDLAGSNIITPSSVGTGPSNIANITAANNWELRGLEIFCNTFFCGQLLLGNGRETSIIGMANHFNIHHNYLHGDPTVINGPARGITNNGTNINIHDNYIAGFTSNATESQAYASSGSPGPTFITNNFMEAGTEIVLLGGDGNVSGVANANVTLRSNYFYKPPIWKWPGLSNLGAPTVGVDPCFYDTTDPLRAGGEWYMNAGTVYQCGADSTWHVTGASLPASFSIVKNSFEFKNGHNITLIGNVHNYSWANNQSGQCIAFHHNYDSGAGADNSNNIAINNKCLNVYYFFSYDSFCLVTSAMPCLNRDGSFRAPNNHTIFNNVVTQDIRACGIILGGVQTSCGFSLYQHEFGGSYPEVGMIFSHNTIVAPSIAVAGSPTTFFYGAALSGVPLNGLSDSWTYQSNILTYDFQGDSTNGGNVMFRYMTHSNFNNNAMIQGFLNYSSPGATNTFTNFDFPANNAAMQFVNLAANDYHLTSGSPHSADCTVSCQNKSVDGTDLGADIDMNNMVTSGAQTGTPPWNSTLSILIGSTMAAFRFIAPTPTEVYTLSLYSTFIRIPSNFIGSIADSATTAISDVSRREIPLSGLTPSAQYSYRIANPSGSVVIVGTFTTKATGITNQSFTEGPSGISIKTCNNKAMTVNCSTQSSSSPLVIGPNMVRYTKQVADNGPPYMRITP